MKEQTFQEKLSLLLKAYEQKGDTDMATFLDEQATALGFSEAQKRLMTEACAAIERIDAKAAELKQAKSEGTNRKVWMEQQIDEGSEQLSDEQKDELLEELNRSLEDWEKQIMTTETEEEQQ